MQSINPSINALHAAFTAATAFPFELRPTQERFWHEAHKAGITPQMVTDVVRHRQRRIEAKVRHPECLRISNLVGTEEMIDLFLEEAAMLAARKRIKVMPPDQASVMRTTGRSDQVPDKPVQASREVIAKLAQEFKQAAGI